MIAIHNMDIVRRSRHIDIASSLTSHIEHRADESSRPRKSCPSQALTNMEIEWNGWNSQPRLRFAAVILIAVSQ
jgi:hypothetical protein